jgi:hypothetical protein
MGAIARSAANLITTSGVVLKGAVNNDSFDNVTALPSSFGDGITLISSQTASASATISFTSGLTSTYKAYKFVFVNIHPATDATYFTFQGSTDGGSNYNTTITSTDFRAYHAEDGSATALQYSTVFDQAQGTAFQPLTQEVGNDNDQSASGTLHLFNPSSTTFVKHFIGTSQYSWSADYSMRDFTAGYFNTTSAINAITI